MNKGIKLFTILISILSLSLMPFSLFADSNTYYEYEYDDAIVIGNRSYYGYDASDFINGNNEYIKLVKTTSLSNHPNIRVISYTYNTNVYLVAIALSDLQTQITMMYSYGSSNMQYNQRNINGTTYYYMYTSISSTNAISLVSDNQLNNTPPNCIERLVYYTYGDGAIGPTQPVLYGELNDLGFYTAFTNSQQATLQTMKYNKDVFSWDNTYDTLGNQINVPVGSFMVDIQGAISDYEANTKNDLLNQVLNDASIGNWNDIASVSANAGTYVITWEEAALAIMGVYDYNTNIFEELVVRPFEGYYIKKGWIYRVRLRASDDSYIGNWQIVYNLTSMPPKDSNNVINHYYVYNNTLPSDDTNEVLQTINQYNNTVNNWYVNDTPIPVNSNDSDNTLLQTILNLLNGSDDSSLITIGDETQQTINNAINTEDDYLNDLQDQLDDLELNDISENNGLMNSLNWIRQVHNLTVEQTLYSGIVITILSVGLIIYLIGRRNG